MNYNYLSNFFSCRNTTETFFNILFDIVKVNECFRINDNWRCSLLASQGQVAIDAVGVDFLINEFTDAPDLKNYDQYMKEAALANNPPSGVHSDP